MAYTQADLDAIKAAYRKGLRSVSFNGETVNYMSAAEMAQVIRDIEAEVNPVSVTRRPVVRKARFREA